ncbi:hypothetical protein [Pseudostreptobacillus hongkongensis]|uniref:hypothetical protein n=1 Tax=Pseudostreptobacillus hongkongensis TaxID=1162717 RepID=UPI000A5C8FA9|nr:hypothetical protein [Pseudostreptobacillus hongkongensis]
MAKILHDKYYTPNNVVKKVIELIERDIKSINEFDRIIEPSSGGVLLLRNYLKKQ